MIRRSDISAYLRLKRAIADRVFASDSGFQPSRRELSEGLAREFALDGETWVYAPAQSGYTFTNPRKRFSVFIADDEEANAYFATDELSRYLQCYTTHEHINDLVVDNWCAKMCAEGLLERRSAAKVQYRLSTTPA